MSDHGNIPDALQRIGKETGLTSGLVRRVLETAAGDYPGWLLVDGQVRRVLESGSSGADGGDEFDGFEVFTFPLRSGEAANRDE